MRSSSWKPSSGGMCHSSINYLRLTYVLVVSVLSAGPWPMGSSPTVFPFVRLSDFSSHLINALTFSRGSLKRPDLVTQSQVFHLEASHANGRSRTLWRGMS